MTNLRRPDLRHEREIDEALIRNAEIRLATLFERESSDWKTYKMIAKPVMYSKAFQRDPSCHSYECAHEHLRRVINSLGRGSILDRRMAIRDVFATADALRVFDNAARSRR